MIFFGSLIDVAGLKAEISCVSVLMVYECHFMFILFYV